MELTKMPLQGKEPWDLLEFFPPKVKELTALSKQHGMLLNTDVLEEYRVRYKGHLEFLRVQGIYLRYNHFTKKKKMAHCYISLDYG